MEHAMCDVCRCADVLRYAKCEMPNAGVLVCQEDINQYFVPCSMSSITTINDDNDDRNNNSSSSNQSSGCRRACEFSSFFSYFFALLFPYDILVYTAIKFKALKKKDRTEIVRDQRPETGDHRVLETPQEVANDSQRYVL